MITVTRRPGIFRSAENYFNECGAYQLRAVLNAFGKDALPSELYHSSAHRERDWSLPWLMPRVLARHDIAAEWHFWPRSRFKENKLGFLTREQPVLYVVNSIRGTGCLHWLSSWGHDPSTDEFLVYDSQAPESEGPRGMSAPAGNTRYTSDLLLSKLPWRGTFALTIKGEAR